MSDYPLYRTETAISSLSAHSLAWDTWAHDSLTALGMAAIRNPLGDRLIHFINSPTSDKAMEIAMMLTTRLMKDGHEFGKAQSAAYSGLEYWNGRHCLNCHGRGVMNFEQEECPRCGGTGDRPIPSEFNECAKFAVSLLIEAENWMENQLRKRMAPPAVPSAAYVVSAPVFGEGTDFTPECGQKILPKSTKQGY